MSINSAAANVDKEEKEEYAAGAPATTTSASTDASPDSASLDCVDCPLCLLPLEPYDYAHPLQCPSHKCDFNFCGDCLERMIRSAAQDRVEASSDGNAFRVLLQCPNCRSDLGPTIRDTLLLRRADRHSRPGVADERLSASQLSLKHALVEDEDVVAAIAAARRRETAFLGRDDVQEDVTVADARPPDSTDAVLGRGFMQEFYGQECSVAGLEEEQSCHREAGDALQAEGRRSQEMGVQLQAEERCNRQAEAEGKSEACCNIETVLQLYAGQLVSPEAGDTLQATETVAKLRSGEFCNQEAVTRLKLRPSGGIQADPTLLCGLDSFMTYQEQKFVTSQLVSGDTAKLAAATEMMYHVAALSRRGIRPNLKREFGTSMLENIIEIIREDSQARQLLEAERLAHNAAGPDHGQVKQLKEGRGAFKFERAVRGRTNKQVRWDAETNKQMERNDKRKQTEYLEKKQEQEYMELHPLPLRMPKYAEVAGRRTDSFGVSFQDDVWDGTVLDAYTKVVVHKSLLGNITVTRETAVGAGVRRVVEAGARIWAGGDRRGQVSAPRPRVVVTAISPCLGRQGVVRGDVLSHLGGEAWTGTAAELATRLEGRGAGEVLALAFNVDPAVAEALRRRATVAARTGGVPRSNRRSVRSRPGLASRARTV